jgi:hypothetical protein
MQVAELSRSSRLEKVVAEAAADPDWFGGMSWEGRLSRMTNTMLVRFDGVSHVVEVNPDFFSSLMARGEEATEVRDEMKVFVACQVAAAAAALTGSRDLAI